MKAFLSLILFISFSLVGFAQQDYPDSGFTNRAEAKNLMVNGKQEGKWVEYYYADGMKMSTDTNPDFYDLSIYKRGKIYGISRRYYWYSRKLFCETHYTKGKKNGIGKTYYSNGKLHEETLFVNDKRNGVEKIYYENGKIQSETTYSDGVAGATINFDQNGNEIK